MSSFFDVRKTLKNRHFLPAAKRHGHAEVFPNILRNIASHFMDCMHQTATQATSNRISGSVNRPLKILPRSPSRISLLQLESEKVRGSQISVFYLKIRDWVTNDPFVRALYMIGLNGPANFSRYNRRSLWPSPRMRAYSTISKTFKSFITFIMLRTF